MTAYAALPEALDPFASDELRARLVEFRRLAQASGEAAAEHRRLTSERPAVELAERTRMRELLADDPTAKSGKSLLVAHDALIADAASRAIALREARDAAGQAAAERLEVERPVVMAAVDADIVRVRTELADHLTVVLDALAPLDALRRLGYLVEHYPDAKQGRAVPITARLPIRREGQGLDIGLLLDRVRDALGRPEVRREFRNGRPDLGPQIRLAGAAGNGWEATAAGER